MSVRLVKWGFSQWGQTVSSITCLLRHLSVWATELQCTGLFSAYQTDKIAISCTVVYRVFQLTVCVISPYKCDMTTVSRCSLHSQSKILWYLLSKTWEKLNVKRALKQRTQGKMRTGQTICLQCIDVSGFFFNRNMPDLTVLLFHDSSTYFQSPTQLRYSSHSKTSFPVPCRHKFVSSLIAHRFTTVYTTRPSLNVGPPRFCIGSGNIRQLLGDELFWYKHNLKF